MFTIYTNVYTTSSLSFLLDRRAKCARHAIDHARRPRSSRLKTLSRSCTPLTKFEEKETCGNLVRRFDKVEDRPLQSILKSAEQVKKERIRLKSNGMGRTTPFSNRNNQNFRLSYVEDKVPVIIYRRGGEDLGLNKVKFSRSLPPLSVTSLK